MNKSPVTLAVSDRDVAEGEAEMASFQQIIQQANRALAKAIDQSVEEGEPWESARKDRPS